MNVTFLYDTAAGSKFDGSCGAATHNLRNVFKSLNYSVEEIHVPLSDKTSEINLPEPKKENKPGFHFFFEELFSRCSQNSEFYRHPNIALFLLRYFSEMKKYEKADALFFCSKYLMDCYQAEALFGGYKIPYLADTTLALPIIEFPDGYPSYGERISPKALNQLCRESYVGHALRPRKMDCFATLSLLYGLNRTAKKRKSKPFNLIIPEVDFPRFKLAIEPMEIPRNTLDYLIPVEHLDNSSMVTVMKKSDFSFCYDEIVEGFGYYPNESIYCGSPVFTNGSGNVRNVVPANHGLFIAETLTMYFGTPKNRIDAYVRISEKIFDQIISGNAKNTCALGKKYIETNYSRKAFTERLKFHIEKVLKLKKEKKNVQKTIFSGKFQISPYLRLADWTRGQFVTDMGNFENKKQFQEWKKLLSTNKSKNSRSNKRLDVRVLFQK
jgi:hypothetical protein